MCEVVIEVREVLTRQQPYTAAIDRGGRAAVMLAHISFSSTVEWASITIITVQLLMDAGLLQVHVFTIIAVATYRHINEEMAPDFFRKFTGKTRPCAKQ